MKNVVMEASELEKFFLDQLDHAEKKIKEAEPENWIEKAFWHARVSTLNEVRDYIHYFAQYKDM